MCGLLDREDDVLDELRKQQDVGNVRVQCLLEQPRRAARRNDQDRGAGVLTNSCKLVRGQGRAPGRMEDGVQVTARQRRSAFDHGRGRADHFDLGMVREGLAQLLEPFAGAGGEDAHPLALCGVSPSGQCGLPKFAAQDGGLFPGPSKSIRAESSYVLGLSSAFVGGRRERCQP